MRGFLLFKNYFQKFPPESYELMGFLTIRLIDEALEKKEERKRRPLDEFVIWY